MRLQCVWFNLTLVCMFCSGYEEERPEVPMLFRDVPSLLIIFVLTMPQPLRRGTVLASQSRQALPCQPPPPLTKSLSAVIKAERWQRSLSRLLSVRPVLLFGCRGHRVSTPPMGGQRPLRVPFTHILPFFWKDAFWAHSGHVQCGMFGWSCYWLN